MKTITVKVSKVAEIEPVLQAYSDTRAFKLGMALSRTEVEVKKIMDVIREKLKGSENLQKYRVARQSFLTGREKIPMNEYIEFNMKILEQYGVAAELQEIEALEAEYLKEDVELNIYPVSLECEPGYGSDGDGLFTAKDRMLLLEVGILEWPEDSK